MIMDPLFRQRMESLLGDQSQAFFDSMEQPLYQGLRISPRKQSVDQTLRQLPFLKEPSPFAKNTWFISGSYGLTPAHVQGLIYLQEPSAGCAVEAMEIEPDNLVLDLCAAPGSKSTQILDHLDSGFLVSNEIDPARAQILLSNMERMGAENFMVTNTDSATLAKELEGVFDKILVDAPCSGEGMMKKHFAAMDQWSYPNILLCAARQKDILKEAWKMLKPGGELVYSTCTYALEENELNVAWALENLEGAVQLPIAGSWGRQGVETPGMDASLVKRVFPMDQGEGHFAARLKKTVDKPAGKVKYHAFERLPQLAETFIAEQLDQDFSHYHIEKTKDGQAVYGMMAPFLALKKVRPLRQGVLIGRILKNRFEPEHAFYLSAHAAKHLKTKTETSLEEMNAFYHGQQLSRNAERGWRGLCFQGIPYGFGKSSQSRITCKLPKGLRLQPGSHVHEVK